MYKKTIFFTLLATLLSAETAKLQPNKLNSTNQLQNRQSVKTKLTIADATVKAINGVRLKAQICSKATTPVRWNKNLYEITKEHSIDMAVNNMLSHIGSGTPTDKTAINLDLKRGSYFYERVNQKKDSKKILSGELVIRTNKSSLKSPKQVIDYWVKQNSSCKIIMDPRFSNVAMAKVISNKDGKSYWTLMLIGDRKK